MVKAQDEHYTPPAWHLICEHDKPYMDATEPGKRIFKWPLVAPAELHVTNYGRQNGSATLECWMHDYDGIYDRQLIMAKTEVQLTSQRAKADLVRTLTQWDDTLQWPIYIELVVDMLLKDMVGKHKAEVVTSNPDLSMEPEYLLEPLLYRGHPTVVFGSKASAKSLLAQVISYIVQLPLTTDKLRLKPGSGQCCNVYYGDWEDSPDTFTARWTAIQRGFRAQHPDIIRDGLELPVVRRTMTEPLARCVDSLYAEFEEHKIGLFIVDSLGPAAGGDLYAPQAALDFYEAIRTLGVTTLILAHHSKDPNTKGKTIFGSQFFTTLARSVWYAERDNEIGDPTELTTSITEHQCNLTATHGSIGFRYQFNNEARTITVTHCDLAQTGLRGRLPIAIQVKAVLGRHGSMNAKDLAEELEMAEKSVRKALERLERKGAVLKSGKKDNMDAWVLTAEEQHRDDA